jgi:uncharacterized iron-regulated membrane protein
VNRFTLVTVTGGVAAFVALVPRAIAQPEYHVYASLFWALLIALFCGAGYVFGCLLTTSTRKARVRAAQTRDRVARAAKSAAIIARASTDESYERRLHQVADQVQRKDGAA